MDQPFVMDPLEFKPAGIPQMRRGPAGDEHELLRSAGLDSKYGYPQSHHYPPSSSLRNLPVKGLPMYAPDGMDANDPRYAQDPVSSVRDFDEKRLKYYAGQSPFGHTRSASGSSAGPALAPNMGGGVNVNVNMNMAGLNMNMAMGNANMNMGNYNNMPSMNMGGMGGMGGGVPMNGNVPMGGNGYFGYNMVHMPGMGSGPAPLGTLPFAPARKRAASELVAPIPPLHVQQELASKDDRAADAGSVRPTKCSRCKKEFVQRQAKDAAGGGGDVKLFKLCQHCRDLQRERSRRWQMKTKDKGGVCRRCGMDIPADATKYVLCPECRKSLRSRKARRAASGRCVHCSGPIESSIIKAEQGDGVDTGRRASNPCNFKVCERCRENDRIRRSNLERMGNCNRCARALSPGEQGKHKVCLSCRLKKKKAGSVGGAGERRAGDAAPAPPLPDPMAANFPPADPALAMPSLAAGPAHDYLAYGPLQAMPDAYKMGHLPQMQPPVEQVHAYAMQPRRGYSK